MFYTYKMHFPLRAFFLFNFVFTFVNILLQDVCFCLKTEFKRKIKKEILRERKNILIVK